MYTFSIFIQALVASFLIQFTTSMEGYFLHAVDDYPRGIWVNDYEYVGCCTDSFEHGTNYNYSIRAEPGDHLIIQIENIGYRQGITGIVQLGSSDEGRFDSNTYESYWSNPDGIERKIPGYTWYGTYLEVLGNDAPNDSNYTFVIPYFSTCKNYQESFTINTLQVILWNFDSWIESKIPNAEKTNRLYVRFRKNTFGSVIMGNTSEVTNENWNYTLDIDYTFKPSTNVYGQYTWYYYGYSITGDSSSDCKVNINICYPSCFNCSSTENLSLNDHKCILCLEGFAKVEINGTVGSNCYNITWIKQQYPNYYHDQSSNTYYPCFKMCDSCNTKGNETENNCLSCNSPYYWHQINFNCYQRVEKPENFYYDDNNRVFKKCHSTCATCKIGGNDPVHNCESCIQGYSFITTHPSNCIDKLTKPENFYHNSTDNTLKPCHDDCQTCLNDPDSNALNIKNCETCKANYYFLAPRGDGNCIKENTQPMNYYWDEESQIYQKCYNSCKECDKGGDDSVHHCKECLSTEYHWEGLNSNNCVSEVNKPMNTYLDKELDAYLPCHSNCSACVTKEETNKNNCKVCKENYYFIDNFEDGNCIDANDKPNNYYLLDDYIFKPCYDSCANCTIGGTEENNNCSTCLGSYHWIINHKSQCVHESKKPENYYLDTDDTFKPCHESCRKCEIINNDSSTNCLECIDNHYFLYGKELGNCISQNNKPDDFYLDTDYIYKKCHEKCASCETGAVQGDTKCTLCSSVYFFDSENSTNCVNVIPEGYYRDGDVLKQCYNTCKTCSFGMNQVIGKHNCEKCKEDYYWTIEMDSNCISKDEKPDNYYWDTTDAENHIYKQCHELCKSCNLGGTEGNNNCWTCVSEDYALITSKPNNCIKITDEIDNYYYDETTKAFEPCFGSCLRCTTKGFSNSNNCSQCIDNYAFIESRPNNCIKKGSQPENYFYDVTDNTYKYKSNCYSTCESCTKKGDTETHYCLQCETNWEYTTGSPEKGNCYDLNTITLEEITLKDFIPLDQYENQEESGKPFEFKEIKIENYSMYYYTTRTVFHNINFPLIQLNECEEMIRNEYNINEDEDIIIGEIVNNESSNIIEYKVFLQTGEEVNLQVCSDNNKWIDMHLYMLRERVNNTEIFAVKNKISLITNKIQIDDWFNTNSSFYNDPCLALSIDNKDFTLSLRQEIYEKDIFTCGKDCVYNISFISNNTLICKCDTSNEGSFDDQPFNKRGSTLLSCLHLLSSFPAISETWAHWIILGTIGWQIAGCSLFWFLNVKDIVIAIVRSVTNPPHIIKNKNKSIELQDHGHGNATSLGNSRSLNPNNNYWKSSVRILQKKNEASVINVEENQSIDKEEKHRNKDNKYTIEELNHLNKSDSFKYDKRSFSRYYLEILKEKLIIISLFTHERQYLPISIQIIIQTFIVSLIFSFSSIFSTEESITSRFTANSIFVHLITKELGSAVSIGLISYVISRILIVLLKYGLYRKKNSAKEGSKFICIFKVKVIVLSITVWLVNVMLWIYMFVFGMVYPNNQLTLLLLSTTSIVIIVSFQIIIYLVLAYLRNWTRRFKNTQCLFSMLYFAYWLL